VVKVGVAVALFLLVVVSRMMEICRLRLFGDCIGSGVACVLVGGSPWWRSSRRRSPWLKGSPSNLKIPSRFVLPAVVFRISTTSKALCNVGGPQVTAQLAPISLSQVVMSPATMRLTASGIIAVEEESDLIAFSLLLLRFLVPNVRVSLYFPAFLRPSM
jgi:hypothetical protein